jgi:hypothetical protein
VADRDLAAEAFLWLRETFLDESAPRPFRLRPKRGTQDDPFDEYVINELKTRLPRDLRVVGSPGPLTSPDLVVADLHQARRRHAHGEQFGLESAVAIEVKKHDRTGPGAVRATGMDFNTTPPCGTIRAYSEGGKELLIPGFYLFVLIEKGEADAQEVSTVALCDGNVLNDDFDFYHSIVGPRTKQIALGSYGDGANRHRPMLVFPSPLGWAELDRRATLLHRAHDLATRYGALRSVGTVTREPLHPIEGRPRVFYCYRHTDDPVPTVPYAVTNPFPPPVGRSIATRQRGKFVLELVERVTDALRAATAEPPDEPIVIREADLPLDPRVNPGQE